MKPKPSNRRHIATAVAISTTLWGAHAFSAGAPDLDGDGIPNIVDPDIDNDGIPNALDRNIDGGIALSGPFRGQYIGDHIDNDNPAEKDIDSDGLADDSLGEKDIDNDGKPDDAPSEDDIDGDGRADDSAAERDIDGDGRRDDDVSEDDIDGDGRDDDDDLNEDDIDGDGISDDLDDDIDGDNRGNGDIAENDTDGDGRLDDDDDESNDDGDSLDDRNDGDDDNDGDPDEDDADHHHEDDEVEVEISLDRITAPKDSRCRVKIQRMANGKIEFEIDGRDRSGELVAGDYEIVIDGTVRGLFPLEGDPGDLEGEVEFETNPNKADELPLDFDVIGLPIEIRRAGTVYFAGTVPTPPPGPGEAGNGETGTGTSGLTRGDAAPLGAHAAAEVEFDVFGADELEVEIEDIPAGDYDVLIGEQLRGLITVVDGRGKIRFNRTPDDADEFPLDFAVAGQPISVQQGAAVFFFGQLPLAPGDITDNPPGGGDDNGTDPGVAQELVAALTPAPSLSPEAGGEVQVKFGIAGPVGLEVEAEEIPVGDYDITIGDTVRAVMSVIDEGDRTRGKVRFETAPDDASELPLDFLAVGLPLTISKDGVTVFSGTVPSLF